MRPSIPRWGRLPRHRPDIGSMDQVLQVLENANVLLHPLTSSQHHHLHLTATTAARLTHNFGQKAVRHQALRWLAETEAVLAHPYLMAGWPSVYHQVVDHMVHAVVRLGWWHRYSLHGQLDPYQLVALVVLAGDECPELAPQLIRGWAAAVEAMPPLARRHPVRVPQVPPGPPPVPGRQHPLAMPHHTLWEDPHPTTPVAYMVADPRVVAATTAPGGRGMALTDQVVAIMSAQQAEGRLAVDVVVRKFLLKIMEAGPPAEVPEVHARGPSLEAEYWERGWSGQSRGRAEECRQCDGDEAFEAEVVSKGPKGLSVVSEGSGFASGASGRTSGGAPPLAFSSGASSGAPSGVSSSSPSSSSSNTSFPSSSSSNLTPSPSTPSSSPPSHEDRALSQASQATLRFGDGQLFHPNRQSTPEPGRDYGMLSYDLLVMRYLPGADPEFLAKFKTVAAFRSQLHTQLLYANDPTQLEDAQLPYQQAVAALRLADLPETPLLSAFSADDNKIVGLYVGAFDRVFGRMYAHDPRAAEAWMFAAVAAHDVDPMLVTDIGVSEAVAHFRHYVLGPRVQETWFLALPAWAELPGQSRDELADEVMNLIN